MKKPSCETCMYCQPSQPTSEGYGECRGTPPAIAMDYGYRAVWPVVFADEWCGQWRDATPEYKDPLGDRMGDRLGVKHD